MFVPVGLIFVYVKTWASRECTSHTQKSFKNLFRLVFLKLGMSFLHPFSILCQRHSTISQKTFLYIILFQFMKYQIVFRKKNSFHFMQFTEEVDFANLQKYTFVVIFCAQLVLCQFWLSKCSIFCFPPPTAIELHCKQYHEDAVL